MSQRPLEFTATHARVSGTFEVSMGGEPGTEPKDGWPEVIITDGSGERHSVTASGKSLEWEFWAPLGAHLKIVPSNGPLRFHPASTSLTVPADGCPDPLEPFVARSGRNFRGTVKPRLANARISVKYGSGKNEGKLITEVS